MSTTNPNPFATPASLPQANVMNQYNASGIDLTPGQRGIMAFRQRGGTPLGAPLGNIKAPNQPTNVQTMQAGQMATGPGRIRPPSPGYLAPRGPVKSFSTY